MNWGMSLIKTFIILPQNIIFLDLLVNCTENILRPNKSDDNVLNNCISRAENNVNTDVIVGYSENQLMNDWFFVISNIKIFKANIQLITMGAINNIKLNNK
jgi:hypothetical protein